MTTLIIPLGGKSTRYGTNRPKWLLTHPDGSYMLEKAIDCMQPDDNFDRIVLAFTEEVVEHFQLDLGELMPRLFQGFSWAPKVSFVLLQGRSRSQFETVARAIKSVGLTGGVMVKDCDNAFSFGEMRPTFTNSICTIKVDKNGDHRRLQQKCFVKLSSPLEVCSLHEKEIVSDEFAVGGYYFVSAQMLLGVYESMLPTSDFELYMSHAINYMIHMGLSFTTRAVNDYQDWGTLDEWRAYCAGFSTLFVDIDGVLVENASRAMRPYWGESQPIMANVEALKSLDSKRTMIVLVTARPESFRPATERQLDELGIKRHALVMGINHAKRLLINDFGGPTSPYPTAEAWSVKRNSGQLAELIASQRSGSDEA